METIPANLEERVKVKSETSPLIRIDRAIPHSDQTGLVKCMELKIMFADSILQKHVAFVTGKRSFTQDLKDDVTLRSSLAIELSEIATSPIQL